jgi:hypothetical protein
MDNNTPYNPFDNPYSHEDPDNPFGGDNPYGGGKSVENLDSLLRQGDDTIMGGLTEAAKQDYETLMQKWWETNKYGYESYIEGQGGAGKRYEERHGEYLKRVANLHSQSIADQEEYGDTLKKLGREYKGKIGKWAGKVRDVTDKGLTKARDMRDASLAKMENIEAEYKDYSDAATSAQSAGIASQYQDQKAAKIDEMKRSGASQSAIDQATYSMDRDMGQQLQGQIASSMGNYQKELAQLGMSGAQMQANAAGQEAQFVGMEAEAAGYEFQGKKAGLDYEMGARAQAAQSMNAVKQSITQQKTIMEAEHLAMQGRYDELKFQGQAAYAEFLKNNPMPQAADFFAMELQYASMPNSNYLRTVMMPGEASKRRVSENSSILSGYPDLEGVNLNLSQIDPDELRKRINRFFSEDFGPRSGSLADYINSGSYNSRGLAV